MEVKKGYKQTEIGVIPEDWNLVCLKEVSSLKGRIGWQGLKQDEFTMNSNQPFLITGMNFKDGEIRWDEVYHVPFDRYELAKEIQLRESDVLMTKDGTIGKLLYVSKIPSPGLATLNSHLLLFRPLKKSYFPKYLYYNLHSKYFKKFIEENKSGTTFFGISQESVGNYLLSLPSFKEQTAIANALSDTDTWINSLEKLLTKKRQIKQGAMQELLQPKEGWEVKKLGKICEIKKGKGISKSQLNIDGKYRCILYGELFTTYKEVIKNVISRTNFSESISSKKEDILFPGSTTTTGIDLAKASTILESGVLLGGDILIVRKINYDYNSIFLTYFLNVIKKNEIAQNTKGITIHHLYGSDLADLQVQFPEIEEQTRIAAILSDMDDEIAQLETKLAKAKQIKQGMMQELLTGKTRLV